MTIDLPARHVHCFSHGPIKYIQVHGFSRVSNQKDLGSNPLRLFFLFTSCGLWTLSYDFVPHNYETLKWLSSLPTLMQKSFWWGQCSNRYIISLSPHLHTPFPPFSPSLINLVVSVDVKHGVYLLYFSRGLWKYRMSSSSCCLLDRPHGAFFSVLLLHCSWVLVTL